MPTVEGLQFSYALHLLGPGRLGFRRWRWEVWHGASLLAAGWHLDRRGAERAIHRRAGEAARRILGLRDPAAESALDRAPAITPGAVVRLEVRGVPYTLVPRGLETPTPAFAA